MVDTSLHVAIIKLVIAYTLLGAFIFTVIITCLSLVGLVKFTNQKQQNKLFTTLIVELVVICVGTFSNLLNFAPQQVQTQIQQPLVNKVNQVEEQNQNIGKKLQDNVLAGLQPEAADLATKLIERAREKGIEIRLISGYRSLEQQKEFYERRLSAVDVGTHNTGLAFDIGVFKNGVYIPEGPEYDTVGAIGKELGLVWGGDNPSFPDKPHFETRDAQQALQKLKQA